MPYAPKVLSCATGCIFDGIFVGRNHNLRKFEKLRNIILALIANHLFDRLIDIHRGSFALDHRKRNSVDKQNDVGTCILLLVQTVTRKLLCHMKYIIFGMLPVNIFEVKALGRSVHKLLGITLAKHQSIIDLFTGTHQTVGKRLIQLGNSSLYILGGKLICNAAVSELV